MRLVINGEERNFDTELTIEELLARIGIESYKVAIECNLEIIPRSNFARTRLNEGDKLEIVHFIGGGNLSSGLNLGSDFGMKDPLVIAGREFSSRLIIGTGKYKDYNTNRLAAEAAEVEIVTVAVRRVNISDPDQPLLMDDLDPKVFTYLPNTAGCFNTEDALRTLRLAREVGNWDLVKLEILGEQKTLYPQIIETLEATKILTKEGFQVMVYCTDDPIMCKRLEDAGAVAIMPLGAPIGSGLGIQNPVNIRLIVEQSQVPVIVDAGVGTSSDAAIAMELGCDGVLMNTAIAEAGNPILMAQAMKYAVRAGRAAYLAGRMKRKHYADPSSPLGGLL